MKKTKDIIMNNMTLAIVRNIAYSQINKINKKIKEEIEIDNVLLKRIREEAQRKVTGKPIGDLQKD